MQLSSSSSSSSSSVHRASTNLHQSQQAGPRPRPLDRAPVSLVSPAISRVLARITPSSMLGMSRRYMVFDLQLGPSTSDRTNTGSLNLNRFIISCLHPQSLFQYASSLQKSKVPDGFAALSLAIAQEGSCEPYHHARHRTLSHRARRGLPQMLFLHASNTNS